MYQLARTLGFAVLMAIVLAGATAAPAAAQSKVIDVSKAMAKGPESATVAVIEFSDYQCPYCSRSMTDFFPLLDQRYVQSGKVRYFFMDFPLAMHAHAFQAAEAARCAGDQGAYWKMHDHLFQRQREISPGAFSEFAQELDLDAASFQECLEAGRHGAGVKADMAQGKAAGVTGTPIFLIGHYDATHGEVKVVQQMRGVKPFPMVEKMIDPLLAGGE